MSWPRVSTRPAFRSSSSNSSNSFSGSCTDSPFTVTTCRSMSIRTGPADNVGGTSSPPSPTWRRRTARTRATSSRGEYVTKPYSPRELVARVRAVLRRQVGDGGELVPPTLSAGPVRMDIDRHVVTVNGESVQLPLKEFELLELLLRNAGRVLTRGQLIDRVWGADYVGDTKTLDVHVKRLRSKIEPESFSPRSIVTVRGLGYKFEP